jgi:putative transposase
VRPETDEQVTELFRRLTLTHTMWWHSHYQIGGTGHLYHGRFKSFPMQSDEHLLCVMRYVERNPLRANLVELAEQWRWGSAWARRQRDAGVRLWLAELTYPTLPRQRRAWVNKPQTEAEVAAIRHCIERGALYGSDRSVRSTAARLGLGTTLRPRGRPKKES